MVNNKNIVKNGISFLPDKEKLTNAIKEINTMWDEGDKEKEFFPLKLPISIEGDKPREVKISELSIINFEEYKIGEDVLKKVFKRVRENNYREEDVIEAVVLLDSIYHTRLSNPIRVAKNVNIVLKEIENCNKDNMDEKNDIVHKIATIDKTETETNNYIYSFATKICSQICPEKFPIFDKFSANLIFLFLKKEKKDIKKKNLGNYKIYLEYYDYFINNFILQDKLNELGKPLFKVIDIFLWTYGRALASKKCGYYFDSISYIPK